MNTDVFGLFNNHVQNIKSSGTNQWIGNCPFPEHQDRKASFSFNSEHGLYNCKGCGEEGNAIKFAKAMGENPEPYYSEDYKRTDGKQTGKAKTNNTLITYNRLKSDKNGADKQTVNKRAKPDKTGINRHIKDLTPKLKEYEIKYPDNKGLQHFVINEVGKDSDGAITIPYFDKEGRVIGIKHHKPKNGKQSWWEGDGKLKWYNAWWVESYKKDWLIVCEGEKDANRLNSLGYQAVSTSGGALSVPPIEDWFKKFKVIIILYDNDEAGHKGSSKCAEKIYRSTGTLPYIGQWREGLPKGYDAFDDTTGEEIEFAMVNKIKHSPSIDESITSITNLKGYKVESVYDAMKLEIPKPPMIVEDILNERGSTILSAEDNVGKSMMANQLGCSIAIGEDFLGYKVPNPYKVLLVQHEMENGEQLDRLKKQTISFFDKSPELFKENLLMQMIQDGEQLAVTNQFDMLDKTFEYNSDIQVCVFDNIGMSTNVAMTKPDEIRNELKRLKTLCRKHNVAFILVAHHNKIDWGKEMDLNKPQIQGGKPVTDWADNVIQLHTSSLNTGLVLMKLTKVRSIHNEDGISSKDLPQAVWFNKDNNLLFTDRFTVTNWQGHFKALDKFERELEFVKELAEYPQPFTTQDAMNVGEKVGVSISTVKGQWLKKLVNPMGWLIKENFGEYRVNQKTLDFINISDD